MAIDRLVEEAPNRAVVIAASNLSGKNLHATGVVSADLNNPVELKWRIFPNDTTINELEIWYSKNDSFDVEVVRPNGLTKLSAEFGEKASFSVGETSTMVVVNRKDGPNDEDNTINVFFEQDIAPGIWTLRLRGASIAEGGGRFNAWIERDETGQSRFEPSATCDINDDSTLGSIACGKKSIVVGGYDAHQRDFPLCEFSSRGPTRDGRQKPEISAPGQDVFAAHSRTLVERHQESGTSMSAASVTGVVALMMAEAMARKISLNIDTIREILIETARTDPPVFGNGDKNKTWDPHYGHGRVSAEQAVAAVSGLIGRNAAPPGAD
ncbi:MAG TPA: S8 family serine peptidase [Blastocatellia bacterium]|nr:S8 family serine peptidase [Blastocatellia bacterium]